MLKSSTKRYAFLSWVTGLEVLIWNFIQFHDVITLKNGILSANVTTNISSLVLFYILMVCIAGFALIIFRSVNLLARTGFALVFIGGIIALGVNSEIGFIITCIGTFVEVIPALFTTDSQENPRQ